MFTLEVIVLLVFSFLFGSVLNMMLLSKYIETRAIKEEIDATQNRGDNMNGLSNIKNLSTKRFYRSIFGVILLVAVITGFVLSVYEVIPTDYELYVYIIVGLFFAYVLFIEKTITITT